MSGPEPDPYAVLGVPRTASPAEVTAAYRRLVRRLHPDVGPPLGPDEARGAEELRRVLDAYAVLGDSQRRASYDQRHPAPVRRVRPPPPPPPPPAPPPPPPQTRTEPARRRGADQPYLLWIGPVRRDRRIG